MAKWWHVPIHPGLSNVSIIRLLNASMSINPSSSIKFPQPINFQTIIQQPSIYPYLKWITNYFITKKQLYLSYPIPKTLHIIHLHNLCINSCPCNGINNVYELLYNFINNPRSCCGFLCMFRKYMYKKELTLTLMLW